MLLHYFFLSAFAWMLVEGLHLYSAQDGEWAFTRNSMRLLRS